MVSELTDITTAPPVKQSFTELYEQAFPATARFVSKMGGSFQDAKDIFHDAMIVFFEKTTQQRLQIRQSPEAYVLGIAKHLWLHKFKTDRDKVPLDAFEASLSIPADFFLSPTQNKILHILERTGRKCMDLLQAFYYHKHPMQKIAKTFGYTNTHTATVQKYKCLEKVRTVIRQKSISYEDLLD